MDGKPCSKDGTPLFTNQCSIRMGYALQKAGFDVSRLAVRTCRDYSRKYHNPQTDFHPLAAEELAKALADTSDFNIGETQKLDPKTFSDQISGKTGIIFFKDYWQRKNPTTGKKEPFENRTGDHIDLWNRSRLTNVNFYVFWSNYFHKYDDCKEIWFWTRQIVLQKKRYQAHRLKEFDR